MLLEVFGVNPLRRRSFPGCPRGWSCLSRSLACRTCRGRCPSAPCRSRRRPGNRQSRLERDQEKRVTKKRQDAFQTGREATGFFSSVSVAARKSWTSTRCCRKLSASAKSSEVFIMICVCVISAHWWFKWAQIWTTERLRQCQISTVGLPQIYQYQHYFGRYEKAYAVQ